jgi:ABC-type glycerol-3-phosphate transport system permease component
VSRVIEAVPGEGFIYAAVGTLLFSRLLLRGPMIPVLLPSLGVVASVLLILMIVMQRAGGAVATNWSSPATWFMALPMLVFELAFATWLLTKGIAAAPRRVAGG